MGAQDKSQSNANSMQRVKVYRLSSDGKWDDLGTGHVTVDYFEQRSEELGLYVIDEEDNDALLVHRISPDDIYKKQEDTIISWRDPEHSTDIALSFQETAGCSYIWDNICNVRRNMHFSTLNNETFHSMNSELRELPSVELSTLPLLLKTITESGIADQIRLAELILSDQDFFRKLMEVFKICEDLENFESLHMIYRIVKGIVLLNNSQIFEKIFGDELIMDIIGCLEYDPDISKIQHHRNFLKEQVLYKEAIQIKDPVVLSKIHQTYRVGYIKDVVLPRVLDEATVANLNSIVHANNAVIISLLKDDNAYIQELFTRLKSPSTPAERKKILVQFLHEFCGLSKSLQMVQQLRLFRDLMTEGIFDVITECLQNEDKKLVLTGTDILILFLNQDPNLLRSYVIRQEGITLLGFLVKGMLTDFEDDMHCQFLEILRSLLDSYTLSGAQRDTIVDIFYEKHLGQIISVITASCPSEGRVQNQTVAKPEILCNICELLCFCVLHHPYRIKSNFLLNNVMDKVLLLTKRREKYLVVAAIRFVRTILTRHDEHLINHIVNHNLLKPILDVFIANGDRYNLLNSAVLELFEYIRKENLKPLVKYIVDSFWNRLVKFESMAPIHALKVKYEQCLDSIGTKGNPVNAVDPRKRSDERAMEKEEEDYFNEESDDEDTSSASVSQKVQPQPALSNGIASSCTSLSARPGGLVDYDDDEDDEDYKPPPKKQAEEDEGALESLRLKRKLGSTKESEPAEKKARLGKSSKSKDSVFIAICSTLNNAASNRSSTNITKTSSDGNKEGVDEEKTESVESPIKTSSDGNEGVDEEKMESVESPSCSDNTKSNEENLREKETIASRSCSDCVQSTTDGGRLLGGDECSLIPPKSSPEMAVNGS
ncbi:hypothetical protein ACFE04_005068 [Oxalis oulophora]